MLALVALTLEDYIGESVTSMCPAKMVLWLILSSSLVVHDYDALPGCYPASAPSIIIGTWIIPAVIESEQG